MTPPTIREAIAADLDTLAAIHDRASRRAYAHIFPSSEAPPTVEEIRDRWRPAIDGAGVTALVAEVDSDVVGGVIADTRTAPGLGHLRHLYVDPPAWGSGAGRRLHDAAVDWCAAAGLDAMDLWVLERNERARAMYERWGWELEPDDRFHHEGVAVTEVRYRLGRLPRR